MVVRPYTASKNKKDYAVSFTDKLRKQFMVDAIMRGGAQIEMPNRLTREDVREMFKIMECIYQAKGGGKTRSQILRAKK